MLKTAGAANLRLRQGPHEAKDILPDLRGKDIKLRVRLLSKTIVACTRTQASRGSARLAIIGGSSLRLVPPPYFISLIPGSSGGTRSVLIRRSANQEPEDPSQPQPRQRVNATITLAQTGTGICTQV